jgi:hypothetical protein
MLVLVAYFFVYHPLVAYPLLTNYRWLIEVRQVLEGFKALA